MAHHLLQQQHKTLVALGSRILEVLPSAENDAGQRELRVAVARFRGALLVHQRMENDALYPHLLSHGDPSIAGPARALYDDLGGIYQQFVELETSFGTPQSVHDNLLEYGAALKRTLRRLMQRMQREDAELYPLVERANLTPTDLRTPDESSMSVAEERARWQRGLAR